jgi:hypothetical protein
MFARIASIPLWLRVAAVCALILAIAMPGLIPTAAIAEGEDPGAGREVSRRDLPYVPDVGRTGDDDQPTIGGRKHGREFTPSSAPTLVTDAPRQGQPVPQAHSYGWPLHMFVLWFLVRLGVMLR